MTSEQIRVNLINQEQIVGEVEDFVQQICDEIMEDKEIKKRGDIIEKLQLIKDILKRFGTYYQNGFANEIFSKLNEYQELQMIHHQEKYLLLNTIEDLRQKVQKNDIFLEQRLQSFQKIQQDAEYSESNHYSRKLNEIQNTTDFLLEKIKERDQEVQSNFDTNSHLKNLEEKVDHIFKLFKNEKISSYDEDNQILSDMKFCLQLYRTNIELLNQIDEQNPNKIIIKQQMQSIKNIIYTSTQQIFSKLFRDLKQQYEKLKKILNNNQFQTMSSDAFTLVHYFIPEDNETEESLNTFGIPKPKEQLLYADIENQFPLKGEYVFRFKTKFKKQNIFVDVIEKDEFLPLCDSKIIFKANRINWDIKETPQNQNKKEELKEDINLLHDDHANFF